MASVYTKQEQGQSKERSEQVYNVGGHPVDSSRMFLQLTCFASAHESASDSIDDPLAGIISPTALRKLLTALNYRDIRTVRHSRRVAILCTGLAGFLGWDPAEQKKLEVAALLHDIGKIGVPDHILFKPGKLSPDESELMAFHHNVSIDILQACQAHSDIIQFVVQAHRYYDSRLDNVKRKGQQPSQGARILAIADAYDSLASEKTYRSGNSHEEIMNILEDNSGTQFDGNLVSALSRWIDEEGHPLDPDSFDTELAPTAQIPDDPQTAFEALSLSHVFSYLHVLESLYDGFYIVDSDNNVSIWNRGMEHLTKQSSADVLGTTWNANLCKYGEKNSGQLPEKETPLMRVKETQQALTSSVEIPLDKGKTAELEVQTIPLMDQMGRHHGVVEIVRNLSRNNRHPQEYRELQIAASQDALTSVANRGELETRLAEMISDFAKDPESNPFSLIFLDVDFFKNINDTFGHTVGDNVLIDIARLMKNETYSEETVGRYGGEEFVILCPATKLDHAIKKADRIRIAIPKANIGGIPDYQITASFGVAECEIGDSIESLLRRADKALYTAKETGRNKTCSFNNSDLVAEEESQENANPEDPFLYEGSFRACVAADLLVCKLKGFVADYDARVKEVNDGHTVMHLGRKPLFGGWGRSDDRRPVEVLVEFGDDRSPKGRRGGLRQTTVSVKILPIGRIRDVTQFQQRARRVMRLLRSYFAASAE